MFKNNSMDNISITGIAPLDYYPCLKNIVKTKQNMKDIDVLIPCEKPDIESIEEVKVSICILNTKIIDTILGKKLIFNAEIKLKVIYTANNCEQSVHSAHWTIPLCDFVLLDNVSNCDLNTLDLFSAIEDICIRSNNLRCINFSVLYIVCVCLYNKPPTCSNPYVKTTPIKNKNQICTKGNFNKSYEDVDYY